MLLSNWVTPSLFSTVLPSSVLLCHLVVKRLWLQIFPNAVSHSHRHHHVLNTKTVKEKQIAVSNNSKVKSNRSISDSLDPLCVKC